MPVLIQTSYCPNCQSFVSFDRPICGSCGAPRPSPHPTHPDQPFWQYEARGPIRGRPILLDELVVFAWGVRNSTGGVLALDRHSGERLHAIAITHPIERGWTAAGKDILVGTLKHLGGSARLLCYRLEDGKERWNIEVSGGIWAPPVVTEARVYVGTDDGGVRCVDRRSGAFVPAWQPAQRKKGRIWPALGANGLLILTEQGEIDYVGLQRGRSRWPRPLTVEGSFLAPPVVDEERAYFGTKDGAVYALDLRTAELQPLFSGLKRVTATPVVDQGVLYVGGHDHRLHAYDLENDRPLWRSEEFKHSLAGSPSASDGLVAATVNGGDVVMFDAPTGEEIWRFRMQVRRGLMADLVLHEGVVYAGSDGGQIAALPWHLGRYARAGDWLAGCSRWIDAGEAYALAAQLEIEIDDRDRLLRQAVSAWEKAGALERAARMWDGAGHLLKAAQACTQAGERVRFRHPRRAAEFYNQAAQLYWREGRYDEEVSCRTEASRLDPRPLLRLRKLNVPVMTRRKADWLSFRLENIGQMDAHDLNITLGGSLLKAVECKVLAPLAKDAYFDLHLEITPTRAEDTLLIFTRYDSDPPRPRPFTTTLGDPLRIEAGPPPHKITVGDMVYGKLRIANESGEPLELELGDQVKTEVEIVLSQGK